MTKTDKKKAQDDHILFIFFHEFIFHCEIFFFLYISVKMAVFLELIKIKRTVGLFYSYSVLFYLIKCSLMLVIIVNDHE